MAVAEVPLPPASEPSRRPAYMVDEDGIAAALRREGRRVARDEPLLAPLVERLIVGPDSFAEILAGVLADKLGDGTIPAGSWHTVCHDAFAAEPGLIDAAKTDLMASYERNPASTSLLIPLLHFKGYQALQWHRVSAVLWHHLGRRDLALHLQGRMSERLQVDIHPNARIGVGVFIDHASGVVVGETATIGNNVSILQQVTLGGTGKEGGDRHPKIADGTLIGAGAKILGNIRIGRCCRIGAGSVVLRDIPDFSTAAGIPATIVRQDRDCAPGLEMDQEFSI